MRDKFHTALLVFLSILLGYSLASRPANAVGYSMSESAARMADSLEKIERRLEHCLR